MSDTRLARLVEVGIATHQRAIKQRRASHALLEAVAAIVDAALEPVFVKAPRKPRVPKVADPSKLPFGPKAIFDTLEAGCADIIQMRPYDNLSFGRLGKSMARIQGLEVNDLELVASWLQSGGIATWPTKCTWAHVCRHFGSWVAQARAWSSNGGVANPAALGADAWR